jgi:hypothetical protein
VLSAILGSLLRRVIDGKKAQAPHARAHPGNLAGAVQRLRRAERHDAVDLRRDGHQPGQPLLPFPQQGRDHRVAVRRLRARHRGHPGRADTAGAERRGHLAFPAPDFESIWKFRFLYRDINELLSRNRLLETHFKRIVARKVSTATAICKGLVATGDMRATPAEIQALA